MKTHLFLAFLTAACLCLSLSMGARAGGKKEEPAARSPEHKVLAGLVGTYHAKVKFLTDPKAPVETALLTRIMILDGNYLEESLKGKFSGKDFAGVGIIGYDAPKKKYVSFWFDNLSDSTTMMQGTYDAEKQTFTTFGEDTDAEGRKMKARDVLRIVSPNEQIFEKYWQRNGGAETKIIEITYTRKNTGA